MTLLGHCFIVTDHDTTDHVVTMLTPTYGQNGIGIGGYKYCQNVSLKWFDFSPADD